MPKDKPAQAPDLSKVFRMTPTLPVPAAMMAPQAAAAWKAQDTLMAEWERYAHAWFERRRDAAESARRCMEHMREAGGADGPQVDEAVGELNAWMTDEMRRLSTDTMENMDFCMRCFGLVTQAATSAGAELADAAKNGTRKGGAGGQGPSD